MQLSENLNQFILRHINSVEQVEILLMLKETPFKDWTPEEIARVLFTQRESVSSRLADLANSGLVAAKTASGSITYRYAPHTQELESTVDELARDYPKYRVSIINLIFSKPIDKIRTFADAFRFTKNEDKK